MKFLKLNFGIVHKAIEIEAAIRQTNLSSRRAFLTLLYTVVLNIVKTVEQRKQYLSKQPSYAQVVYIAKILKFRNFNRENEGPGH